MSASESHLKSTSGHSETLLSLSLLGIVVIMLIPLPALMLDLLLALNLCISLLLLLITLGVKRALDLSVFPSLLLVITLFRLALNVASTRRILLSANGGHLVDAFGSFVVGGNLIVGFVIFLILVIIQFVVITKGAGRVSEVSARFTLDSLPGKQLAIDADLNAGNITEQQARLRREELGQETDFYGAMDGASKFVRGDAIAGLIITSINLVGGIALGVTHGLSVSDSVQTYSVLTIGDGLVSQVPALIIAITAGILVTKTTSTNTLGSEIETQILGNDRPLWIGFGFLVVLILLPGLPKLPFIVLAAGTLFLLSVRNSRKIVDSKDPTDSEPAPTEGDDELNLKDFLFTDRAVIEVGTKLIALVNPTHSKGITQRIKTLRRDFSQQRGLWIPPIRVRSNFSLNPDAYEIRIAGRVVGSGDLRTDKKLAIPPENARITLPGEETSEPAFGLPAIWIDPSLTRQAESHGYAVVDAAGVMLTHLGELLKRHGHELITRESLKMMMDSAKEVAPTIVNEIATESVKMSLLHQTLQQLVAESVSLADFPLVLEAISNHANHAKTPDDLTNAVREELRQLVCQPFYTKEEKLRVIAFDPELENSLRNSLRDGRLAVDQEVVESLVRLMMTHAANSTRLNLPLVLLVDRSLRRPIRRLLGKAVNETGIISYQELPETAELEPIAILTVRDVKQKTNSGGSNENGNASGTLKKSVA